MRTTVASLVPVRAASALTVRREQPAGSAATVSATACTERVMEGPRLRTRARSGTPEPVPSFPPSPSLKVTFGSSLIPEIYFRPGWGSRHHSAPAQKGLRHLARTGSQWAHGPRDPLEQALHTARALVLADLVAGEVAEADVVSLVEDSVTHRRWWVEQWPEGVDYLAGLVAQDVQDALLEKYGRWPLCPVCSHGDPHALDVEPELGPDPHWVCAKAGVKVATVGGLAPVFGAGR